MKRSVDPGDRRTSERITTRSLVEVKIPDWQAFRSGHAVNLSQGGIRPGEIAHLDGDSSGDVGVRFRELPARISVEIDGYLQQLRAGQTPSDEVPDTGIPSGALIKKMS